MSFSGTKGHITKPKPGVMLNPLHPLSRGLIGYWLFNEGAGSRTNDISGRNNHGLITGAAWKNNGLEFGSANEYVDIISPVTPYTDQYTLNVIAKKQVDATNDYLFDQGYTAGVILYSGSDWRWYYWVHIGATDYHAVVNNGSSNKDHLITYTYDGSKFKVYINAVEKVSLNASGNLGGSSNNIRIGCYSGGGSYSYDGNISMVSEYNRAFSAEEIKQFYHDPFCNLLQVPIRRYFVAAPPVGAIMNQFQRANIGADLYNGVFA